MAAPARALVVINPTGPFVSWSGVVAGEPTCVLPAAVYRSAWLRAVIGARMRDNGITCDTCPTNCPLSRVRSAV